MLILVFLLFAGIFGIAGVFISIEAKRRNDKEIRKPVATASDDANLEAVSNQTSDWAA